ncbi:MAG: uracil-DNA glycosylase family protein, partial [Alphaproteobacteria bacterium]|nr:uracil-DNA glycosylase family protein [Alphaproteobacteria bacterium]
MSRDALDRLIVEIRGCRNCESRLSLGAAPVFRASKTATLLICGQAPGTRAHQTGIPWNDRSGDVLRLWLDLDREAFYDQRRVAI